MRREKCKQTGLLCLIVGSPPHARGKDFSSHSRITSTGITPACAGKRLCQDADARKFEDHPRMRGEKDTALLDRLKAEGSPPHARGKVRQQPSVESGERITPACAGKSF